MDTIFHQPVNQIMTKQLFTVLPSMPAHEIRQHFSLNSFHHIPVVDSSGSLKGIISSNDLDKIGRWVSAWQLTSRPLVAEDVMTQYPFTLTPEDTIEEAVKLLNKNKFHALPIVDKNRLVGMVTTHDILEMTMRYFIVSEMD